jgi:hypothetical protein
MKVRELLRYEVWSKRTSRKILVWSGTLLGFVIAFLSIWILIERHWLTPGERRAGREALVQVDALQDFKSMSAEEFNKRLHGAEDKINAARLSAWTWRDKSIIALLDSYLQLTDLDREAMQEQMKLERVRPDIAASRANSSLEGSSLSTSARVLFRSELHAFLD